MCTHIPEWAPGRAKGDYKNLPAIYLAPRWGLSPMLNLIALSDSCSSVCPVGTPLLAPTCGGGALCAHRFQTKNGVAVSGLTGQICTWTRSATTSRTHVRSWTLFDSALVKALPIEQGLSWPQLTAPRNQSCNLNSCCLPPPQLQHMNMISLRSRQTSLHQARGKGTRTPKCDASKTQMKTRERLASQTEESRR